MTTVKMELTLRGVPCQIEAWICGPDHNAGITSKWVDEIIGVPDDLADEEFENLQEQILTEVDRQESAAWDKIIGREEQS